MATRGRKSLGDRTRLGRVPDDVYELLELERQAAGVKSVSGFVSDLLCLRYGRKDLVRELNPVTSDLPIDTYKEAVLLCLRDDREDLARSIVRAGVGGDPFKEALLLKVYKYMAAEDAALNREPISA